MEQKNKYAVFVIFCILYILSYSIFANRTINGPLFIHLVIFILTLMVLWVKYRIRTKTKLIVKQVKVIYKVSILIKDLFFYYVVIGISIYFVFCLTNSYYSNRNITEEHDLKIVKVYSQGRIKYRGLTYIFEGKEIFFKQSTEELRIIGTDKNLMERSFFRVYLKKGLFNSYIIKKWEIVMPTD